MSWLYGWSDPRDVWTSDDKLAHFFGGFAAMCLLHSWRAVILAVILVEVVELYRFHLWAAKGFPQPWPWMTDRVSAKDIIAGLAGAFVAWLA